MDKAEYLHEELLSHQTVLLQTVENCQDVIARISSEIIQCFSMGNKLLICGNGGSAADAQHLAAELINRYQIERQGLPAIALTTDSSVLSCIGNDRSFDEVFSKQIEALSKPGDILLAISTSGRSPNILNALKTAKRLGCVCIGFTGIRGKGIMSDLCDHCVIVPSEMTARIQEAHEWIFHVICGLIEKSILTITPLEK
jgi:D-sedoheptulose 7-phosphate isomerase